jgi:hypothetical protein
VVAHTLEPGGSAATADPRRWPQVPPRTARRWRARWQRPAHALPQILAASGAAVWAALAGRLRPAATCADLVTAYVDLTGPCAGQGLAAVAALLYRLQPKVRLM